MQASDFLLKLSRLDQSQLDKINGLGPVLVENLLKFTSSTNFLHLKEKFDLLEQKGLGLNVLTSQNKVTAQGVLSGEIICITGTFELKREEIKTKLEALGAEVVEQLTKNTTILLAGDKAGSKLKKAEEKGIRVVNSLSELIELS